MIQVTVSLTHKGWFGICPVYFAGLHSSAPLVIERHWSLVPLMLLSECLYGLVFVVGSFLAGFEPAWPLCVTGELEPHRAITISDRRRA